MPIVVILAVLGVLLLGGLASVGPRPSAGSHGAASGIPGNARLSPSVILNTQIYLNRSQTSGTYVGEFVALNNSSTLTRIPVLLTVAASTCKWVTVENVTAPAAPVSIFHNVQYRNVTSANKSGTVISGIATTSFKACGATAYWINYVYWTYSVYQFTSIGLGANTTIVAGGFSAYPGTISVPANVSAKIGPKAVAQFIVPSNLSKFTVVITTPVSGGTTCDITGQICSYTLWSFGSMTDLSNTSTTAKTVFNSTNRLLTQSAVYENWTVSFSNSSVAVNTATGAFFVSTGAFVQTWFVNLAAWWIAIIIIVIIVGFVWSRSGRRHRDS